jgi:hypothetical protein
VDNLARHHVVPRLMPVSPVPGLPIIESSGDDLSLSPKNSERYRPYVRLAEALPTDALLSIYARFYPFSRNSTRTSVIQQGISTIASSRSLIICWRRRKSRNRRVSFNPECFTNSPIPGWITSRQVRKSY